MEQQPLPPRPPEGSQEIWPLYGVVMPPWVPKTITSAFAAGATAAAPATARDIMPYDAKRFSNADVSATGAVLPILRFINRPPCACGRGYYTPIFPLLQGSSVS